MSKVVGIIGLVTAGIGIASSIYLLNSNKINLVYASVEDKKILENVDISKFNFNSKIMSSELEIAPLDFTYFQKFIVVGGWVNADIKLKAIYNKAGLDIINNDMLSRRNNKSNDPHIYISDKWQFIDGRFYKFIFGMTLKDTIKAVEQFFELDIPKEDNVEDKVDNVEDKKDDIKILFDENLSKWLEFKKSAEINGFTHVWVRLEGNPEKLYAISQISEALIDKWSKQGNKIIRLSGIIKEEDKPIDEVKDEVGDREQVINPNQARSIFTKLAEKYNFAKITFNNGKVTVWTIRMDNSNINFIDEHYNNLIKLASKGIFPIKIQGTYTL